MQTIKRSRALICLFLVLVCCLVFVPRIAQAAGTQESDTANNVFVYADDASGNQVLLKVIPLSTLKAMGHGQDGTADTTYYGSFIDSMPTPTYCEGRGITIPELINYVTTQTSVANAASLTYQGSDKLYFYSCDAPGNPVNYTYNALLGVDRYYFPLLYSNWDSNETEVSNVSSVLETQTQTPVYLATESMGGRVFAAAGKDGNVSSYVTANGGTVTGCLTGVLNDMDVTTDTTSTALRLVIPQTEDNIINSTATYSNIRKWVYKIRLKEVDTSSPIVSVGTVSDPICTYTLSGNTLTITMSCADSGASIYYSTIGGVTQTPVNLYTGPITVNNYDSDTPFTLGVVAVKEGYVNSNTISASSANISDDAEAPSFTYALSSNTESVKTGTAFTVSATLSADKSYTLYGAEYQLTIPTAYFTTESVSAATGWEYGTATVDDDTVVTFTYLNTEGQAVEASTATAVGSISLTPLQAGSTSITANKAIVTRADAIAYSSVSAGALSVTVASGSVLFGDVNSDSNITMVDALCIAKYVAGTLTLTVDQVAAADVNHDGSITMVDALRIAKYVAGTITGF